MSILGKVISYNLLAFLIYAILVAFSGQADLSALLGLGISIIHAIGCLVASIVFYVKKDKERGGGFLISMIILLVVGFSYCFGAMASI